MLRNRHNPPAQVHPRRGRWLDIETLRELCESELQVIRSSPVSNPSGSRISFEESLSAERQRVYKQCRTHHSRARLTAPCRDLLSL